MSRSFGTMHVTDSRWTSKDVRAPKRITAICGNRVAWNHIVDMDPTCVGCKAILEERRKDKEHAKAGGQAGS